MNIRFYSFFSMVADKFKPEDIFVCETAHCVGIPI